MCVFVCVCVVCCVFALCFCLFVFCGVEAMASRLLVVGLGISATVVGIDFFKDNLNDWIQSNMITEEERNRNFREHMGRMRERCDKKCVTTKTLYPTLCFLVLLLVVGVGSLLEVVSGSFLVVGEENSSFVFCVLLQARRVGITIETFEFLDLCE